MVKFHVQHQQGFMERGMYKFLVICLLLIASGSVLAEKEEKQYLCTSEVAGGFSFNDEAKSWKGAAVGVNGTEKYVIKLNDRRYPKATATVTPFGEENPVYKCGGGNKKLGSTHTCHAVYGQFFFNQNTLRYLLSSMGGYINGKDENTDHFPFIEGGTCSPL